MTTTETQTMTLLDAVTQAGIGGRIQRDTVEYIVSQDEEGEFVLCGVSRDTDPASLSIFMQDNWRVTLIADEESQDNRTVLRPDRDTADPFAESDENWEQRCANCDVNRGGHNTRDGRIRCFRDGGWSDAYVFDGVPTSDTVNDFFQSLRQWCIISDGYSNYIFTGYTHEEDGIVYTTVNARYMSETKYQGDQLRADASDYGLSVVTDNVDGNRETRMVDRIARYAIRQMLSDRNNRVAAEKRELELEEKLAGALSDFKVVNEHINAYATESGMCSDYERRIYSWNDGGVHDQPPLNTKLYGRIRNHHVFVENSTLYANGQMHVYIEARSPAEARQAVCDMSGGEILALLQSQRNFTLTELEFTIGEAGI